MIEISITYQEQEDTCNILCILLPILTLKSIRFKKNLVSFEVYLTTSIRIEIIPLSKSGKSYVTSFDECYFLTINRHFPKIFDKTFYQNVTEYTLCYILTNQTVLGLFLMFEKNKPRHIKGGVLFAT